jgi:hypothetical protein
MFWSLHSAILNFFSSGVETAIVDVCADEPYRYGNGERACPECGKS